MANKEKKKKKKVAWYDKEDAMGRSHADTVGRVYELLGKGTGFAPTDVFKRTDECRPGFIKKNGKCVKIPKKKPVKTMPSTVSKRPTPR